MNTSNKTYIYSNFCLKKGIYADNEKIINSILYYNKNNYNIKYSNTENDNMSQILHIIDGLSNNLIKEYFSKLNHETTIHNMEYLLTEINTENEQLKLFQLNKRIDGLKYMINECEYNIKEEKRMYEIKLKKLNDTIKYLHEHYKEKISGLNKFINLFDVVSNIKQQEMDSVLINNIYKSNEDECFQQLGIKTLKDLGDLYKRILCQKQSSICNKNHICHSKLVELMYNNLNGVKYDSEYAVWLRNCENIMDNKIFGSERDYFIEILNMVSNTNFTITDELLKSYYNDKIRDYENQYNKNLIDINNKINKMNTYYEKIIKIVNKRKEKYNIILNQLI